jgi:FtsP/CotA-like multicopper oxidase with cupredoxin domain
MREMPAAQTAPSQPPTWQVKPGDTVRVTLANGLRVQFEVAAVEEDALVADNGNRHQNTDIRRVERSEFSSGRTTVAVIGGLLGALVIFFGALIATYPGGGPV